ncbi:MAG TPA: oxygen-independent coproporphyrinogen III oxidase [Chitinophagaceae bacterium]|nr:oxygen-independent coproporphyrinogen III oxidase [Chitinophagaceae bacterium]
MDNYLIRKYNIPGPRYTSYPTVPYWDENSFSVDQWKETVIRSFHESNEREGISIYIHLPYCENLCTFCACHKRITKQHSVELPYIEALLKEWKLYIDLFGKRPVIKELHLGGGTPTFFSPDHLKYLLEKIFSSAQIDPNPEFSFEGHPNNTTPEHLKTLYDLNFRRVSFGVQDYDAKVQQTIHRIQPFEKVKAVTDIAKEVGYKSVSHDLIFGLPFQTWSSMAQTIEKTRLLKPDRIAFYSYAHVPWIKGVGQRGFDENDLPSPEEKRELYEKGKRLLEESGYIEIGMDHFSLPQDSLYTSMKQKTIHRNFMGYSSSSTQLMIGLGMSAISDSWYAFAQNNKSVEDYISLTEQNTLPIFRGHILNKEDLVVRRHILNLMCLLETSWKDDTMYLPEIPEILNRLEEMKNDGLIQIRDKHLKITETGRIFVRNIAMAWDLRMIRHQPETRIFSMTV